MIVHEDDIVAAKPMGLLESTQRREAAAMGLDCLLYTSDAADDA